jgi:hypothetical protein
MSQYLLRSGTIACSALVMYGWMQPSASEPQPQDCKAPAKDSLDQSQRAKKTAKRCVQTAAIASGIPERLLNLRWNQSKQLPDEIEAMYGDALAQAQASAAQEQFAKAIPAIAGIPKNSRYYDTAQKLRSEWGKEVLRQAKNACQEANITGAIALLEVIPIASPEHQQGVELRQRWNQQATVLNRAIGAQQKGDWQGTLRILQSLEGSPIYQSLKVQTLIQTTLTKLYEPDQNLVQIATADLPTIDRAISPPELMKVN